MINLYNTKIEERGIVQVINVMNFGPILAPCFIWLKGKCTRVIALLSWEYSNDLIQLVEISNGCQVLIIYDSKAFDLTDNKKAFEATLIICEETSERKDNFKLWENFNKDFKLEEYPYKYLFHHTEEEKYPLILESGYLNSSAWNLAGTNKLKITFSNMTDISRIKLTFDLWPIAMMNEDGCNVMIQDDYGGKINADIYVTNRSLNSVLEFKVDTRLLTPCHIIHHYQETEWWEYFFSNIYRICCNRIKLVPKEGYYLVDKANVENYKQSKGFIMASGKDVGLIQKLLYENNIRDFFD